MIETNTPDPWVVDNERTDNHHEGAHHGSKEKPCLD